MKDIVNNDNLYPEGAIVSAKTAPTLKLVITKYRQRIYYCAEIESPNNNNLAYFESELVPPDPQDQLQFVRIEDGSRNGYLVREGF